MSKLTELRGKYSKITENTFNRLFDGDKTPTKKYAEFLLSAWNKKSGSFGGAKGVNDYIKLVNDFENLLPFIDNKDIYSYPTYNSIVSVVKVAVDEKIQKGFDRDGNILVIEETKEHILLIPKTHIGSLKYGSNTKWCTSSATNPSTFKQYTDRGYLIYLIDKTNKKSNNLNKIAFYLTTKTNILSQTIIIYNQIDVQINEQELISGGWGINIIGDILSKIRSYLYIYNQQESVRGDIKKTLMTLNGIRYDDFFNSLHILNFNPELIDELKSAFGMVKECTKKIVV
jgi:hypothetical protein